MKSGHNTLLNSGLSSIVFTTLILAREAFAGIDSAPCYDADSDQIFQTANHVAVGTLLGLKYPQIQYDDKRKPHDVIWVNCPDNVTASPERIGNCCGKEIYRIIYKQSGSDDVYFSFVLCYQVIVPDDCMQIRPFFICGGDTVGSFDTWFSPEKNFPFILEVSRTIKGTGAFTTQTVIS